MFRHFESFGSFPSFRVYFYGRRIFNDSWRLRYNHVPSLKVCARWRSRLETRSLGSWKSKEALSLRFEFKNCSGAGPPHCDQRSWCQWQRVNVSENTYPVRTEHVQYEHVQCDVSVVHYVPYICNYVCNVTQRKVWCDRESHIQTNFLGRQFLVVAGTKHQTTLINFQFFFKSSQENIPHFPPVYDPLYAALYSPGGSFSYWTPKFLCALSSSSDTCARCNKLISWSYVFYTCMIMACYRRCESLSPVLLYLCGDSAVVRSDPNVSWNRVSLESQPLT